VIVAVHQPHFLPWLGYLERMQNADLFIILDHVQFERRGYQNRTRIRMNDEARWLTVPMVQQSQSEIITDKLIDPDAKDWGAKHFQTLRQAYRQAPHFKDFAAELQALLESRWDRLIDLNQATLDFLRGALDIRTPLVTSTSLAPASAKSELILELCKAVGADAYYAGMGGSRAYLDRDKFAAEGVDIIWQEFSHPEHPQCGAAPFIKGLSAMDMLFNCGAEAGKALMRQQPAMQQVKAEMQPA
jgi:hypothetical protein